MPRSPDKKTPDRLARIRRSTIQQRKMETTGILVIAAIIIAITLARYWRTIHWSLR